MRIPCLCAVLLFCTAVRAQEPAQKSGPDSVDQASVSDPGDIGALNSSAPLSVPARPANRPVRLVIARPNSFAYDAPRKHLWVGAVVEFALRLKLGVPGELELVPNRRILSLMPKAADYAHRVSRQEHTGAAAAVNASHLLYSEIEMLSAKEAVLHATLVPLGERGSGESMNIPLDTRDLDPSLTEAVRTIAAALNGSPDQSPGPPVHSPLLGDNAREAARLGEIVVQAGSEGSDIARKARECEKLGNEQFTLAGYAAARLYARAGRHSKATRLAEALHDATGYSQLLLLAARSARLDGRAGDALRLVSGFEDKHGCSTLSCLEAGRALAAAKRMTEAKKQFVRCTQSPAADPQAHVELAKLALLERDGDRARQHLRSASELSERGQGDVAAGVAREFRAGDKTMAAVAAAVLAVEAEPGSADHWLFRAQCHESAGQLPKAAEAYLEAFNLNPVSHRNHLDKAAGLFLSAGKDEAARAAYRHYLAQRNDPEATLSLARIEAESDNCEAAVDLLAGLDQTQRNDDRAVRIARECADKLPPSSRQAAVELLPPEPSTRSRPRFSRRMIVGVPTALVAAGAFAGGIVMDRRLASTLEDYRASTSTAEVDRLHDDIDQAVKVRNALYAASGAAAIGFTVNIVIPGPRQGPNKEEYAGIGGFGL